MKRLALFLALLPLTAFAVEHAHEHGHEHGGSTCDEMSVWDATQQECQPLAMAGMPMRMLMLHGNIFGGYDATFGARARDAWFVNDMVMASIGSSLGDAHYLALELMLTSEKWTVPSTGYPLLLQIGESDENDRPFIDAQHPHSSPIMGLTLSDTIRLGKGKNHLKFFFAPRGESTDGPVAFMHRESSRLNPDAPLGHHIGQDVGHITSTVIGGALQWGGTRFELSAFNGTEPEPTKVDLPLGAPNSLAARVTETWSPHLSTMASLAYVHQPEADLSLEHEWRYSASAYFHCATFGDWTWDNSLIYGGISPYAPETGTLHSFAEEFRLHAARPNIWGRVEVLQRTPALLAVTAPDPDQAVWVTAVTLGYTHILANIDEYELGLGASVTKDFLPAVLSAAYGGNPWSAKAYLYLGGMKMWDL